MGRARSWLANVLSHTLDFVARPIDAADRGVWKLRSGLVNGSSRLLDLLARPLEAVGRGLARIRPRPGYVVPRLRGRPARRRSRPGPRPPRISLSRHHPPPERRPKVRRPAIAVAAAIVVAISAFWLVSLWWLGERVTPDPRQATSPPVDAEASLSAPGAADPSGASSSSPDLVAYVNRQGSYRFSYPFAWILTEQGTDAAVAHPEGTTVVTVGRIEGGSLQEAADLFVGRIASVYEDVEIQLSTAEGDGRMPLTGTATEPTGDRTRFVATLVDDRDQRFAIAAFTPIGQPELGEDAMAILRSFRPLGGDDPGDPDG